MAAKHTHKLKRLTYSNGESIYFCVLDCNYKIKVQLALGKNTVCWRCGREFPINEYSIRLAKPTCTSCKKVKEESNDTTPKIQIPTDDLLTRFRKVLDINDEETTDDFL